MLSTVSSLWLQSILFIIGHLEEFSPNNLALLPASMRRWLFLYLPLADVCLLESTLMSKGIDMEEIWRIRSSKMQADLVRLQMPIEGFWRQRYLDQLWDVAMVESTNYASSYGQISSSRIHSCRWHSLNQCFLAVNQYSMSELSLDSIYTAVDRTDTYIHTSHGIVSYKCGKCNIVAYIPFRYKKYLLKQHNLVSLVSLFYSTCRYYPTSLTLCQHNMCNRNGYLSQIILKKYPDILTLPLRNVQILQILPVHFTDGCTKMNRIFDFNCVTHSLFSSMRETLEDIDIRLMVSPFRLSELKMSLKMLQFLSVSSLHQNILREPFVKNIILHQKFSLRVLNIKQSSFRTTSNLNCLLSLFSSTQFTMLSFDQTAFSISAFQELLLHFFTSTIEADQLLSFKDSFIEGNESLKLPVRKLQSSSLMTKTLDLENIKAAFHTIEELNKVLKTFPPIFLKQLSIREGKSVGNLPIRINGESKSLDSISSLPAIKVNELHLSFSSGLSKTNVSNLQSFLSNHSIGSLQVCLWKRVFASSTAESIHHLAKCFANPKTPLKYLKFIWPVENGLVYPLQDPETIFRFSNFIEEIFKNINKLGELELDISEQSPCPSDILYDVWRKNSEGIKLARVVASTDRVKSIDLWELAEVVDERVTSFVL